MEPVLPPLTYHGYLPEGIHDATMEELQERFVVNSKRIELWAQLQDFLRWAGSLGQFSHVYIDGGFISSKNFPDDVDVILETCAPYGPEALKAMVPFHVEGWEKIHARYSVDLYFWADGFPGGVNDFRRFFQYFRPQEAAPLGLKEDAKKGIVRIKL